jgi:hypothetical protein
LKKNELFWTFFQKRVPTGSNKKNGESEKKDGIFFLTPLDSEKNNLPTKSEIIRHFLDGVARNSFFNQVGRLVTNGYWDYRIDSN